MLESAMGSSPARPLVAAALLGYEGDVTAAVFDTGLLLSGQGWLPWGASRDWRPPVGEPAAPPAWDPLATGIREDMGHEDYVAGVLAVHEAVRRGDVYVLNLTRRLVGTPVCPDASLLAGMLARSEATMGAGWHLPGRSLLSASPERFLRLEGGRAEVHPVKGTRPRGASPEEDARLRAELEDSEKERAEHVMVVDLERNDIGRVAAAGTVLVEPLAALETTSYCHQLVSCVSAELRTDADVAALLQALFPSGSVTGAPKVAAMRHISRLEVSPRGAYCGSLVVALPGRLDSSVLIRTAEVEEGVVRYGVGCGVTIDSDPEAEWQETLLKARPLLGT